MDRVTRTKTAEYRVTFIQRQREVYVYIGAMWAGRIMRDPSNPLRPSNEYTLYLQLPGMWGPVASDIDIGTVKLQTHEAIRSWFDNMTATPEPPPEKLVRALDKQGTTGGDTQRVRRVRAAPVAEVRRVRRTR